MQRPLSGRLPHHVPVILATQEWDDNWRLPREYFQDEGQIPKERRTELLMEAGHRRVSLDLSRCAPPVWPLLRAIAPADSVLCPNRYGCSFMSTNILASRKKHSRNIISKFIVEGFDAEEIHQLDRQVDAAAVITLWVGRQLREAKAKAMKALGAQLWDAEAG